MMMDMARVRENKKVGMWYLKKLKRKQRKKIIKLNIILYINEL